MPRNITVTFADGSKHIYANAPDDISPDVVQARAEKDFGKSVSALDGGRGGYSAESEIPGGRKAGFFENIMPNTQTPANIAAGLVKGASNIGATLLRPFETSEENKARRAKITQALQMITGANPESYGFGAGELASETLATLPVGGALGKAVGAIPKIAPKFASGVSAVTQPIANALASGGFRTGLEPGVANLLTRAVGGAGTGAATAGLINPEDTTSGAVVGAVLPTVGAGLVKKGAKFSGWLWDAMSGRLGDVKAGAIARKLAGGDIDAIRAVNAIAPADISAGQAASGANIDNAGWAALDALAREENIGNKFTRQEALQNNKILDKLSTLATGATPTESRAAARQSKAVLGAVTTPMRETELAAAGTAGKLLPELEQKVEKFTEAADIADKWSKNWAPSTAKAQQSADVYRQNAKDAADRIAALEAHGLKPLKTDEIVSAIESKLTDPDIALNREANAGLTRATQMLKDWTNEHGIITPDALYAIRKNGLKGVIDDLYPSATENERKKYAQKVLKEVVPLIDDALEKSGATGWKDYLKTFSSGMHDIEQRQMADAARNLYQSGNKKAFLDLVRGRNPDAVSDVFGYGKEDFSKEMGSLYPEFLKIAHQVERDMSLKELGARGSKQLDRALAEQQSLFSKATMFLKPAVRVGLQDFKNRVNDKTYKLLVTKMESGATANELLNALPTSERNKVLNIMANSENWNPALTGAARNALVSSNNSNR